MGNYNNKNQDIFLTGLQDGQDGLVKFTGMAICAYKASF